MSSEFPRGTKQLYPADPGLLFIFFPSEWGGIAMLGVQTRLVVEGLHLRRTSVHKQKNDSLGFGMMVRLFRS